MAVAVGDSGIVSFLTPWNSGRPIVVHRHHSIIHAMRSGRLGRHQLSGAGLAHTVESHCETARPLSGEHPDSTTITSPCRTKRPRTCERVDPPGLMVVGKLSPRIPGGGVGAPVPGAEGIARHQLNGVPSDSGIREFISGGGGSLDGFLAAQDPGFKSGDR